MNDLAKLHDDQAEMRVRADEATAKGATAYARLLDLAETRDSGQSATLSNSSLQLITVERFLSTSLTSAPWMSPSATTCSFASTRYAGRRQTCTSSFRTAIAACGH